ncbi:MAG: hypothetical protein NWE89_01515 [Candidatus Bathyarchaeota archaeon]|nr:hypothetical protein [Candidatus Bathyarchaeota archaeon]
MSYPIVKCPSCEAMITRHDMKIVQLRTTGDHTTPTSAGSVNTSLVSAPTRRGSGSA